MLLKMDKAQKRDYTRLYVSRADFGYASSCARFLLKKGWHSRPWERRGSIYFQQSAFTTAAVTAYGRPFSYKREWGRDLLNLLDYDEKQLALHKTLVEMRNEIYAHSDVRRYDISPWRAEDFETDIVKGPFLLLPRSDCEQLVTIGTKAIAKLSKQMKKMTDSFS
jgi:hypothetical protein